MAKVLESITEALQAFIAKQHMFFVATAPSEGGHVNLSPKGHDCLRVLDPHRVAYLDLTGSGNETSAHLKQNGRITFMFCAFDGPPNIVRLYGSGRVILPEMSEWDEFAPLFPLCGRASNHRRAHRARTNFVRVRSSIYGICRRARDAHEVGRGQRRRCAHRIS